MSTSTRATKPPLHESFRHAWDGIWWTFINERNFQIHIGATCLVLIAGLLFRLTVTEWLILLLFLVLIPTLEMLNTAGEQICNIVRDELKLSYEATKIPRDLLGGAVLYVTIGAVIAGLVIFLPKIWALVGQFFVI